MNQLDVKIRELILRELMTMRINKSNYQNKKILFLKSHIHLKNAIARMIKVVQNHLMKT